MTHFALIPAAGGGTRFGADRPKQYLPLAGRTVLAHAIERIRCGFEGSRGVYVLLSPDDAWYERLIESDPRVTPLRCGGATRAETVRNGLAALGGEAKVEDWVAVHDAARPCVELESLQRLRVCLADDAVGGLLAVPITSSVKRDDGQGRIARSESREGLWQAQTPQMFRYGVLVQAFKQDGARDATDEAQAVEAIGLRPKLVMGSASNLKITYPGDLELAEALLAAVPTGRSRSPAERADR